MAHAWVWLCSSCVFTEDGGYVCGSVARDSICARCGGLAQEVFKVECQDPRLAVTPPPYGPVVTEFSTSNMLTRYRPVIWDVNCYYRELGVSPYATKSEIRHAYQRAQGWESERLTYIVKQLLNETVRALYDAVPFGSVFYDHYIDRVARQRNADEIVADRLAGASDDDFEEVDFPEPNSRSFEVVDSDGWSDNDERIARWGYYLWQSNCRDRMKLAQWQELLSRAFTKRKETYRIAVGFLAHREVAMEVIRWDSRTIVFLHEGEVPTAVLAEEAADRVLREEPQARRFLNVNA